MKLKNTAFVYNVTVNGSSNCDWGTDLGQGKKHTFTLEGFPDFINAMVYYKIKDTENIKVKLGKGSNNRPAQPFSAYPNDELVLASCFDKVYLNDELLEGQKLVVYILKELNEFTSAGKPNVHLNRCTLKFSNSLLYNGEEINQNCINAISKAFGQFSNGSWAILEMDIKNEDELHLYGFALGNSPKDYSSVEERDKEFDRFFYSDDLELRRAAFKDYLFAPGTFKTKGTAQQYWNHISDSKYKERIYFVWEALSELLGHQTDDLIELNDIEIANQLKERITPDIRNKEYGNQIASAIIKNYIDFLGHSKLTRHSDKAKSYKSLSFDIFIPFSTQGIPLQQIFFGAPGTSKSNRIKTLVGNMEQHRVTFHPDTDYASFVGCYKPTKDENENDITYKFVAQPFTKAYVSAWRKLYDDSESQKEVFLVIEEINRGNCAQIFGDLFQLLDRNKEGYSDYSIEPDSDLSRFLKNSFKDSEIQVSDIKDGIIMILPPNLYIWATMNTSDQSLFPIDSAFKRRWDWKYTPIKNAGKGHAIALKDRKYDWWEFLEAVNKRIEKVTESEDKQMGYWFAKPDNGIEISSEKFVSKVIFYLWNDVFKDYGHDANSPFVIKQDDGKKTELRFKSFFDEDGEVDEKTLILFFWGLKLETKAGVEKSKVVDSEQSSGANNESPLDTFEGGNLEPELNAIRESQGDLFSDEEEDLPEAKSIDDFFKS